MIAPIDPVLFGAPFPLRHPWASPQGSLAWESAPTGRAHLLVAEGCTACHRGIPRCEGREPMRVVTRWQRATCARCIARGIIGDAEAHARALDLRKPRGIGQPPLGKLGRAIGWWRIVGASASRVPPYIEDFFVESDVDVFRGSSAPEVRP